MLCSTGVESLWVHGTDKSSYFLDVILPIQSGSLETDMLVQPCFIWEMRPWIAETPNS